MNNGAGGAGVWQDTLVLATGVMVRFFRTNVHNAVSLTFTTILFSGLDDIWSLYLCCFVKISLAGYLPAVVNHNFVHSQSIMALAAGAAFQTPGLMF